MARQPARSKVNERVYFDGRLVTVRTRDALLYAQALWQKRGNHHKKIRLAQGSFSTSVDASANTHKGDGVIDVRTRGVGLTNAEIVSLGAGRLAFHPRAISRAGRPLPACGRRRMRPPPCAGHRPAEVR